MKRSLFRISALALVTVMGLSACGERGGSEAQGGGDGDKKVVKIGLIAPLSGSLSAMGKGMENSIKLAVKQANEKGAIPGYTIEVVSMDDEAKPEVGTNAATKLAADNDIIGVVGTLNSSVAGPVQPILNRANILMVSPANTGPKLTRGEDPANNPQRAFPNYFRTCTNDLVQGPFAAQYLFDSGVKKVATIHDKKAYGQGLVDEFTKKFKELGGEIVAAETTEADEDNFGSVIDKIKPSAPGAIYYGGEYPAAGPLSKQMKDKGLNVPLMGGDGIFDGKYIEFAGDSGAGDMATSVGAPIETLESGKAFVDAYNAQNYAEGYSAYGAYAYDAANAIIEAAKTSLKDGKSVKDSRTGAIEAMKGVAFDGVTGRVEFDEFGDTKTRVLTVYKVTDGKWVAADTKNLS